MSLSGDPSFDFAFNGNNDTEFDEDQSDPDSNLRTATHQNFGQVRPEWDLANGQTLLNSSPGYGSR